MAALIDSFVLAVRRFLLATAAVALATLAATGLVRAQATSPSLPEKSVIIQVAPAPAPVAAPAPAPAAAPEQAPPPVAPAPAPSEEAAPRENPGLINELGKLLTAPKWALPSMPAWPALPSLKSPADSGDALPRLTTVVKGRAVCPLSANGAPDCKAGADKLCQSKGFKEGKSVDTDSARTCSPKAFLSGRKPEESDCKTENYVTQALCQ